MGNIPNLVNQVCQLNGFSYCQMNVAIANLNQPRRWMETGRERQPSTNSFIVVCLFASIRLLRHEALRHTNTSVLMSLRVYVCVFVDLQMGREEWEWWFEWVSIYGWGLGQSLQHQTSITLSWKADNLWQTSSTLCCVHTHTHVCLGNLSVDR